MKKVYNFFTKNITLKIIAAISAVIVWLLIINIEDPMRQETFRIKVKTINMEAISSANKVYEIKEGTVARVRVSGKKSIIDRLKKSDITATADLSSLSSVNAVNIEPHIVSKYRKKVTLSCKDVMKLSLEDMERKQIQVEVITEGSVSEGNAIGECIAKPNILQVTGGQSSIEKIDSIRVVVDVDGASASFSKKVTPVAYDSSENIVTSPTLKFNKKKVLVTVDILNTKTVPVNIKISGKPKKGYEYVSSKCLPKKIDITGKNSDLKSIDSITIPVDIDGMGSSSEDLEQNISVIDYLPDGVSLAMEYAMISVKLDIQKIEEKKFVIHNNKINIDNLPDGLKAKVLRKNKNSEIKVSGLSKKLDDIDLNDYYFYVNASGLKEGTYSLKIHVKDNDDFKLSGNTKLKIKITKDKSDDSGDSNSDENDNNTKSPAPSPKSTQSSDKTKDETTESDKETDSPEV